MGVNNLMEFEVCRLMKLIHSGTKHTDLELRALRRGNRTLSLQIRTFGFALDSFIFGRRGSILTWMVALES